MKKELQKINNELYYYKNDKKILVDYEDKSTYPDGLSGNISRGLSGNIGGLSGDVSRLYGNVTDINGDLDECGLTDEDREKGVDIKDLVKN